MLPGSVAEKAGLQPGDRITYLDGHWIAPIHLSFRELSSLEDDLGPQDGRPIPADDLPQAMRSIIQDDLDKWGVTFYEAVEAARSNLEQMGNVAFASLQGEATGVAAPANT